MKYFGCIICWLFAWFFFQARRIYTDDKKDYSGYPVASGTVIGTHDFGGERWMVTFTDPEGNEVIGADSMLAEGSFRPERYTLPQRGETESFYFWKHGRKNKRYSINGKPVLYYIHFCNEDFYQLPREVHQKFQKFFSGTAIVLFLLGIAVLIWGY